MPDDDFDTAVNWLFRDSDRKNLFIKSLNESPILIRNLIDDISSLLQVNIWKGKTVVDLGCGSGGACVVFAEMGAKVIGIEASTGWLKLAKLRIEKFSYLKDKIELHQGNVLNTNIDDSSVDFCFADQLLEHIVNKERLLIEIERMLRPGAHAFLGFPNRLALREHHTNNLLLASYLPKTWSDRYLVLRKKLKPEFSPRPDFLPWPWMIDNICKNAGLHIKYFTYVNNFRTLFSRVLHAVNLLFKIKGFSLIVSKPIKSNHS